MEKLQQQAEGFRSKSKYLGELFLLLPALLAVSAFASWRSEKT